jgi:hypothetical protein
MVKEHVRLFLNKHNNEYNMEKVKDLRNATDFNAVKEEVEKDFQEAQARGEGVGSFFILKKEHIDKLMKK